MDRRTAIRHVALISAGALVFSSCRSTDKTYIKLKNLSLTGSQYDLLAELTDTIIPASADFPGAKELKTDEFLLTMLDDCASPDDQQKFLKGLQAFEETCEKKWGKSFIKASSQQRLDLLKELESGKDEKDEAVAFYKIVKRTTIQNFTGSKQYMTDILKYKIIPGSNFKGCVPVTS